MSARHLRPALAGLLLIVAALASGCEQEDRGGADAVAAETVPRPPQPRAREPLPRPADVRRARRFAAGRGDAVAFAALDSSGRPHGFRAAQPHRSASASKSLLLAGFLDHVGAADLDEATRARLRAMVTYSDNDAADSVYATVGDEGLEAVAHRTGMRDLGTAGYWSETAITARDMARFMWGLERRALRPPHRRFALELLAGIVPEQRWGIPAAAGDRWRVWFKGGWRTGEGGALVNQAALLRDRSRRIAMAVLADGQPSHEYGTETVRGVAARLLGSGRAPDATGARTRGGARRGS